MPRPLSVVARVDAEGPIRAKDSGVDSATTLMLIATDSDCDDGL